MIGSFAFAVVAGLLPEELLLGIALVCVVLTVTRHRAPVSLYRWLTCIAMVGALTAALINLYGLRQTHLGVGLVAYGGSLIVDRFSILCTVVILGLALAQVIGAHHGGRVMRSRVGAHHALVLVATAAASLLTAEREMIALFATFQVLLVSVSMLIALDKTSGRSSETAAKHLLLGISGSAVLLYGLAILYGAGGTTDLSAVPSAYATAPTLTVMGVALTLLGICIAIGAVPLHQGMVQDVTGAPAPVSGFAIVIGVVAGLAIYLRVVVGGFAPTIHAVDLTAVIASITMLYPALMLTRPRGLRSLAGYTIVAQVGFMLAGILSIGLGTDHRAGVVALLVYAMGFGVTVIALFGLLGMLEGEGVTDAEGGVRGLGQRSAGTALCLALVIASLGGLPPFVIFVARMLIMETAVEAGYAWVAIVAAASTVLIAVASLRVIASIYTETSGGERLSASATPRRSRVMVGMCTAAALLFTAVIQPLLAVSSGGAGTLPLR